MDLHRILVFFHVAAVIGLFATLVIEWISVGRLRQSTSYEQAREWAGLWRLLGPVGGPSTLVVLASGIYLATMLGAWEIGWVRAAIPMLILVGIAGAPAGRGRKRIRADIEARSGPIPGEVRTRLRNPRLVASIRFRATLLAAVVFAMTARPTLGAAVIIGSAVALAGVVSASAWLGDRAAPPRERVQSADLG
jgi:hypothetical protein